MQKRLARNIIAAAVSSTLAMSAFSLGALASEAAETTGADGAQAAAAQAEEVNEGLAALAGTYTDLMPAMRDEANAQYWYDALAQYCGIEDEALADQVKDAFLSMYEADFYGNEAAVLAAGGSYSTFDCYLEGVATFTVDGNTISGADENGNQIFSHTYRYIGSLRGDFGAYNDMYAQMYAEAGAEDAWPVLSIYASDDAIEDGFRFFAFSGDNPAETFHIEFRYGDELTGLNEYYTGGYAYFMPSAIYTDYSGELMQSCIDLFVSENADSVSAIADALA